MSEKCQLFIDSIATRLPVQYGAAEAHLIKSGLRNYCDLSDCAHVSIHTIACYHTGGTLLGCADPPYMGSRGTPLFSSSQRNEVK